MAQYPMNVPALTGIDETLPALPLRGALPGAFGAWTAELAVLLLRGSAVAVLLSPALLAAFLLTG